MLVSVIVPFYNGEKTLELMYDSLKRQTYSNIEILFVDNNSTDHSYEIVCEIAKKDRRVKVLREEKQGVAYARKKGFHEAKGAYIYFVDCDDFVSINGIEAMVKSAKRTHADIIQGEFLYTRLSQLYDQPAKVDGIGYTLSEKNYFNYIKQLPPLWIRLYKKEFIKDEYFVHLKQREDFVFTLHAYADANTIAYIPDIVYYYHRTMEGLSSAQHLVNPYDLLNALGLVFQHYDACGILDKHQKWIERDIIDNYLVMYDQLCYRNFVELLLSYMEGNPKASTPLLEEIRQILTLFAPYDNPFVMASKESEKLLEKVNLEEKRTYQKYRKK